MAEPWYRLIVAPEDFPGKLYRGRYAYEHRVVWWKEYGTLPPPGWVIHHENEDKRDNRIANLFAKMSGVHSAEHLRARGLANKLRVAVVCACCGDGFELSPGIYKTRSKERSKLYCSRRCSGRATGYTQGMKVGISDTL